ncbi:facilitated trehalose transporter Tret1-like isoform X2 [Maniola jurtina]|uniref:facilitated trehalose transporter Tret1-like isoform X2 n=1 Tax=Maniola jurtina TaxID=191418 RepID=UPI001E688B54|nr:facilitated trehalose transporter Tret1-like isoform X2 [Maniola jurtina]
MFGIKITGVKRQVIISLCLYLGQIISGYSGGWSGPCLPKLRDLDQSPLPYLLTEAQLSLVATFIYLGAIAGPFIITWLSNTRGRKPCLIVSGVISLLAYVFMGISVNLAMLYVSRFLLGVAGGAINVINLVYIGEIASPKIRGILLTVICIFTTLGLMLVFAVGPYVSYHGTVYVGVAISIVYIFCLFFIPETPIFYALQGRDDDLKKVLQDLGRLEEVDKMLKIKNDLNETNTKKEWVELFSLKSNRKALFIVVTINVLQHCSGVLAVMFFSASIFEMAGSSIESNIAMIIIICFQILGSIITPFFIESTGRRRILLMSTAICSFSMFTLGLYFYLDRIESSVVNNIKWLPLVILIVFYIGYDSGFGNIPNAIIGEMFTTSVRSKGSTITLTTTYLCGFMVTTAFGALLEIVGGHAAFWFFSFTCACAFLFTVFFIPETKGKTLLQIQEDL